MGDFNELFGLRKEQNEKKIIKYASAVIKIVEEDLLEKDKIDSGKKQIFISKVNDLKTLLNDKNSDSIELKKSSDDLFDEFRSIIATIEENFAQKEMMTDKDKKLSKERETNYKQIKKIAEKISKKVTGIKLDTSNNYLLLLERNGFGKSIILEGKIGGLSVKVVRKEAEESSSQQYKYSALFDDNHLNEEQAKKLFDILKDLAMPINSSYDDSRKELINKRRKLIVSSILEE